MSPVHSPSLHASRPVAVSNIVWAGQASEPFLDVLAEEGAKGLELAASLVWEEPVDTTSAQRASWRRTVESRGLKIIGLHSLLYTRKELQLLDIGEGGQRVRDYLKRIVDVCADLGGVSLVLGGPRNRLRGDLPLHEANERCAENLNEVGEYAAENGCYIALESLPPPNCDFITNLHECVEMVRLANTIGVRVHFDTGAADIAEADTSEDTLLSFIRQIGHCHINDYELVLPGSKTPQSHLRWSRLLTAADYRGWVSIEMRSTSTTPAIDAIREAVRFVRSYY